MSPPVHAGACCPVLELRRYAMRPDGFQPLLGLFERTFVREQQAAGMHVLGVFRDEADPLRFAWVRGFPAMPERRAALAAFYEGPVWRALRDEANATMVDSSDVLLLRPIGGRGFARSLRAGRGAPDRVVACLLFFRTAPDAAARDSWAAAVDAAGLDLLALLETEPAENTYPRLPVRDGEHVLAAFATAAEGDVERVRARLAALGAGLRDRLSKPPESLVLLPALS